MSNEWDNMHGEASFADGVGCLTLRIKPFRPTSFSGTEFHGPIRTSFSSALKFNSDFLSKFSALDPRLHTTLSKTLFLRNYSFCRNKQKRTLNWLRKNVQLSVWTPSSVHPSFLMSNSVYFHTKCHTPQVAFNLGLWRFGHCRHKFTR